MSIKLIALDIDGTTLNSKGKILPSTIKAIKEAHDKGIVTVFCSGRSLYQQKPYMDILGMNYIITINGSVLRKANGEILYEVPLQANAYERLAEYSIKNNIPFNFVDEEFNIYTPNRDILPIVYNQAHENNSTIYFRKPSEMNSDMHIVKACYSGNEDLMDICEKQIKAEFKDDFYVVRCSQNFIEIFDPKANKGDGLKTMAKILKIDSSEVMAFGDERNDIPMFKYAKIGVCMGNGNSEAKKYADYITASNDEDGIAKAIKKYI